MRNFNHYVIKTVRRDAAVWLIDELNLGRWLVNTSRLWVKTFGVVGSVLPAGSPATVQNMYLVN